jgi:hypothetical protein
MKGAFQKINIEAYAAYITPNHWIKIDISERECKWLNDNYLQIIIYFNIFNEFGYLNF